MCHNIGAHIEPGDDPAFSVPISRVALLAIDVQMACLILSKSEHPIKQIAFVCSLLI